MNNIEYRVRIGWIDFIFDKSDDAITFMNQASHHIDNEDKRNIELTAKVIYDDTEEDNKDEE